jgi:hypothetical protein
VPSRSTRSSAAGSRSKYTAHLAHATPQTPGASDHSAHSVNRWIFLARPRERAMNFVNIGQSAPAASIKPGLLRVPNAYLVVHVAGRDKGISGRLRTELGKR